MLAILFQEKTKKMLIFPKNTEKNASIIEKGLLCCRLNDLDVGALTKRLQVELTIKNIKYKGSFSFKSHCF